MGEVSLFGALPLAAPALPLDEAGKYVAGAYVVFLVLIVVYVAIMATKLQRIERELRELASFAEQGRASAGVGSTPGGGRRQASDVGGSPGGGGRQASDVGGSPGGGRRQGEDVPVDDAASPTEVQGAAPGRGSEGQSISVSSGPSESGGGGA